MQTFTGIGVQRDEAGYRPELRELGESILHGRSGLHRAGWSTPN